QPTLIVGLSQGRGFSLLVLAGSQQQGLTLQGSYPVSGPVSNILFSDLGDPGPDVAFLAGSQIQILRSSNMQLAAVPLPVNVRAFALGTFIYDRSGGTQFALLAADGSVQFAARNEFDPRVFSAEEFGAIRQAKVNHQPPPSFVALHTFPANGWRIV